MVLARSSIGRRTSSNRERSNLAVYQAVGLTDKGVQREINEDALWLPDAAQQSARALAHWGALYIVADGMGGIRQVKLPAAWRRR